MDQTVEDEEGDWEKALFSGEILNVPSDSRAEAIIPKVIQDWRKVIITQASVTALEIVIFIEYLMLRVLIVLNCITRVVTYLVLINKVFRDGLVTIVWPWWHSVKP